MTKPIIATVELGGPFRILARQVWIKTDDRKLPVTGGEIKPKAIQASSADEGTNAGNLGSHAGLSNRDTDELEEHGVDPGHMWRSAKGDSNRWIEFDLGSVRSIDTISIWNYNDSWSTDRGVSKADISVWTQETGWKKVQDDLAIGQAQGTDDYDDPTAVKLDGVTAQKVRFDDLANFGDPDYVGLSKVQFFEVPGPKATRPQPNDGSDAVEYKTTLTWTPGLKAASHRVCVGVAPADLRLLGTVEDASAGLSGLARGATYYWRIDEVQDDATVAQGEVWSFTTRCDITSPGDAVVGMPDEGVTSDYSSIGWPSYQAPNRVIDDKAESKFLHFAGEVRSTGFCTTPQVGPSVVTGLTFTTANDYDARDPVSWELYGSNESIGGPYQLIARGEIADFNQPAAWPRGTKNATPIAFENSTTYKHYQVLFPAVRDRQRANCMQIAEVELLASRSQEAKPSMDDVKLEQNVAESTRVLAAWWKLDEVEGTKAADSSGNGHDGMIYGGGTWLPEGGHAGGALQFDGVDDYVETDWKPNLPTWTVATWVKSPAAPAFPTASGPVHCEENFQIDWNHGDNAWLGAAGLRVKEQWYSAGFGDLKADTWYHLAATYDGETLKAYKDGVLTGENDKPSGDADFGASTLILGRHATAKDAFFTGVVDDVCLFAYPLEAADVKALHGGEAPTAIAARSAAVALKALEATPIAAVDPNAKVQPASAQPAAEATSRSGKNGIAAVVIIGVIGLVAGVSFFTRQKTE